MSLPLGFEGVMHATCTVLRLLQHMTELCRRRPPALHPPPSGVRRSSSRGVECDQLTTDRVYKSSSWRATKDRTRKTSADVRTETVTDECTWSHYCCSEFYVERGRVRGGLVSLHSPMVTIRPTCFNNQ
jgi:hypothetical protein